MCSQNIVLIDVKLPLNFTFKTFCCELFTSINRELGTIRPPHINQKLALSKGATIQDLVTSIVAYQTPQEVIISSGLPEKFLDKRKHEEFWNSIQYIQDFRSIRSERLKNDAVISNLNRCEPS